VSVSIKREDLNDPEIQGNKWLKLKPVLILAGEKKINRLVTMGGCFSNHIYATAAAGKRFEFETIGIIRGPEPKQYSATLRFAKQAGMQLVFVSRTEFRQLRTQDTLTNFLQRFKPAYFIPEGGTTSQAVNSCAQYIEPMKHQFDIFCCPVGTGGTIAGFIKGINNQAQVIGFPVLKGKDFLDQDINHLLEDEQLPHQHQTWHLNHDYHFGGYAKTNDELDNFIIDFYRQHNILLEPVYTGKMLFGLFDLIKQRYFKEGSKILAIHTGGLQGLEGFPGLKSKLKDLRDKKISLTEQLTG